MNKTINWFLFYCFSSLPFCLVANDNTIVSDQGFKIQLPATWKQIPTQRIIEHKARVTKLLPNSNIPTFDYAFQLAQNEQWFTYPYILIKISNAGRISWERLKNVEKFKSDFGRGVSQAQQKAKGYFSNVKVGAPVYDDKNHILYSTMSSHLQGIGRVKVLLSVILTEKGAIGVYANVLEDEFDHYAPQFAAFVQSIKVDQHLRYTPERPNYVLIMIKNYWHLILLMALTTSILAWIYLFIKSRKIR